VNGIVETSNSQEPVTSTEAATETSLITGTPETTATDTTEQQTTTEPTAEEAKAAEEAAALEAARTAPVTAEDIVFPEGMAPVSDELTKEFIDTLNNSELSAKERATALINLQAKAMTAASEASSAAWSNLQEEWRTQVKTEYGDKLEPTLNSINKLVTEYGDPKLVEALAITGAGNNPEVIKFFSKVATLLTEGTYAPGASANAEKSAAQRLYPSMSN